MPERPERVRVLSAELSSSALIVLVPKPERRAHVAMHVSRPPASEARLTRAGVAVDVRCHERTFWRKSLSPPTFIHVRMPHYMLEV
jgi:hypothetical protein